MSFSENLMNFQCLVPNFHLLIIQDVNMIVYGISAVIKTDISIYPRNLYVLCYLHSHCLLVCLLCSSFTLLPSMVTLMVVFT